MPNWCHNTLDVKGEEAALAEFVKRVRPTRDQLVRTYNSIHWLGEDPQPFEDWRMAEISRRPLTFEAHAPQPSEEEYAALQTYKPCHYCGATGDPRPRTQEEADAIEARTGVPAMVLGHDQEQCNGCSGTGQERDNDPWWEWVAENWGCKWDASFGTGSMFAFGTEDMDPEATQQAHGIVGAPAAGMVVYKFDTPWAPPVPWLLTASEAHPDLEFVLRYGELGHGIAGELRVVAGVAIEDKSLDIEEVLAPEEMWF